MTKPKKILILESIKADQELIKEQFLKYDPQCIFIIALDRDSFFEKIDWFSYDVVLSSTELNDLTALEAVVFLEENLILVPFVFLPNESEQDSTLAKTMINKADAVLLKEDLPQLPHVLENIIANKSDQQIHYNKSIEKLNRQMIMLQKLKKLIAVAPNFEGKYDIENILQKMVGK